MDVRHTNKAGARKAKLLSHPGEVFFGTGHAHGKKTGSQAQGGDYPKAFGLVWTTAAASTLYTISQLASGCVGR